MLASTEFWYLFLHVDRELHPGKLGRKNLKPKSTHFAQKIKYLLFSFQMGHWAAKKQDAVCGWSTGVQCSLEACSELHPKNSLGGEMIGPHLRIFVKPIHVWYIYLKLVDFFMVNVGKYTIHGCYE